MLALFLLYRYFSHNNGRIEDKAYVVISLKNNAGYIGRPANSEKENRQGKCDNQELPRSTDELTPVVSKNPGLTSSR
jgi:hypothetical protein